MNVLAFTQHYDLVSSWSVR